MVMRSPKPIALRRQNPETIHCHDTSQQGLIGVVRKAQKHSVSDSERSMCVLWGRQEDICVGYKRVCVKQWGRWRGQSGTGTAMGGRGLDQHNRDLVCLGSLRLSLASLLPFFSSPREALAQIPATSMGWS